ncbi:MAG: hypothetical protein SCJ93_06205 [Bacillota bacterium]|nr:hypothetical protein [Bacillota bacterium]
MNTKLLIKDLKKTPRQMLAYFIIGLSINWIKSIDLGMNAWSTLNHGITLQTGIAFGTVSQIISVLIIIASMFMKIYPGYATILNAIFIGYFINVGERYHLYYVSDNYYVNLLLIFVALLIFNIGLYMYLSCNAGAGPRDGLMIGFVKLTGKSVTVVRTSIEATVFVIGWLLGGTVGIGTIITTFLGGYTLDKTFKFFNYSSHKIHHTNIMSYFKDVS